MVLNPYTTIFAATANALTTLIFFYVSYQLLRFWKKEKDPMSAALASSIFLLAFGLLFEVISEIFTISIGVVPIGDFFTYLFFACFILSYAPMGYFYVGLFHPRNRWYLPMISFAGGFSLALIFNQSISYGVPLLSLVPFAILTFSLYIPLYISCRRTAPKAPKLVTQMKFRLIGRFAILYMVTFVLFGITGQFQAADVLIGNLVFLSVAIIMMITVIHAWFGWAMPEFLRKRYASKDTLSVAA